MDIYVFFCQNLKTLTADHEIRKGSDGKELPGPRELQLGIFLPRSADFNDVRNFHVMQMNQWITHDITLMATDPTGKHIIEISKTLFHNFSLLLTRIKVFEYYINNKKSRSVDLQKYDSENGLVNDLINDYVALRMCLKGSVRISMNNRKIVTIYSRLCV